MAQDVIVRGVTYTGVEKLSLPISGGSALFRDTSDADASASDVLSGKKAYNANGEINGGMTNQGAVSGTISDKDTPFQIPQGYHNGSGNVEIAAAQKALLVPGNIRNSVTILGVTGNYTGGGGGNSYLLNIDFSLAAESFTSNNVIISNGGAYFNTAAAYIWLPFSASGRTIEIDISTSEMTSNAIRSLISQWATGSSHLGLAWHSATGKWGFYDGSWRDTDIPDINYFANSILKVYIDSNNKWHFYKDGVLFFEPTAAVAPNGVWSVGANNISCIGLTITGIRVY